MNILVQLIEYRALLLCALVSGVVLYCSTMHEHCHPTAVTVQQAWCRKLQLESPAAIAIAVCSLMIALYIHIPELFSLCFKSSISLNLCV
jgi:hypothetical protein